MAGKNPGEVRVHQSAQRDRACRVLFGARLFTSLMAIPSARVLQRGDSELRVAFAPGNLELVATLLRARRHIVLSEAERVSSSRAGQGAEKSRRNRPVLRFLAIGLMYSTSDRSKRSQDVLGDPTTRKCMHELCLRSDPPFVLRQELRPNRGYSTPLRTHENSRIDGMLDLLPSRRDRRP